MDKENKTPIRLSINHNEQVGR